MQNLIYIATCHGLDAEHCVSLEQALYKVKDALRSSGGSTATIQMPNLSYLYFDGLMWYAG